MTEEVLLPNVTPVGSRLTKVGQVVYYSIWKDIAADVLRTAESQLQTIFEQDLKFHNLSAVDIKGCVWVFDLKPEGISSKDFHNFHKYLAYQLGIPLKNIRVIFSCVEDVSLLPYPAVSLPDRLIYNGNWYMHLDHYHIDWKAVPMTHKLVCLMRRPSVSRANIVKRLLSHVNRDDVVLTFGTNGADANETIEKLIYPQPFPIIVDRPMADEIFQHRIDHDLFYRAPLNLIPESSSQLDPNTWESIFITEKTFKAFAWHQFPIWYAVPGLVTEVRQLGFDVFDDLFDNHSYDQVVDPWVRMTQVILLTKKLCNQNLASLREQHWSRLEYNASVIKNMHTSALDKHNKAIEDLVNGIF